jgi:hypothetical protein
MIYCKINDSLTPTILAVTFLEEGEGVVVMDVERWLADLPHLQQFSQNYYYHLSLVVVDLMLSLTYITFLFF